MTFKEKLERLIEEKNVSIPTISEATGVSSQTIYSILKRDSDKTKLSHLNKLSEYFNVSLDYLVDDNVTDKKLRREPDSNDVVSGNAIDCEGEILRLDNLPEEAKNEMKNFLQYFKYKYDL